MGKRKTKEEARLEALVFGDDEIAKSLESPAKKKKKRKTGRKKITAIKSTAWEDSDSEVEDDPSPESSKIGLQKKRRAVWEDADDDQGCDIAKPEAPRWATQSGPLVDDDSDDELMRATGDRLAPSPTLPSGVIDIKQLSHLNKESPHEGKVTSVEFHPWSQVALTASMDHRLCVFEVDGKTNPKLTSLFLDNYPIYTAHFTTDGNEVVMGSRHKSFHTYDMIEGKHVVIPGNKGLEETNMKRFEVSPDGRFLVFLGRYGRMHLLSQKSKQWIQTFKMNGDVEAVTFSPDGSKMFSHGAEGRVFVWDLNSRDCVGSFYDEGCLKGTSLAASNDGRYLACGSYSGVVNIYDVKTCLASNTPKPLKAVMNLTTACTSMKFNSSSEILAIGSSYTEKAVKLVHMPSLTVFSNFPDRQEESLRIPFSLDFSLNSGYFTVATHRGSALLYRLKHFGSF